MKLKPVVDVVVDVPIPGLDDPVRPMYLQFYGLTHILLYLGRSNEYFEVVCGKEIDVYNYHSVCEVDGPVTCLGCMAEEFDPAWVLVSDKARLRGYIQNARER